MGKPLVPTCIANCGKAVIWQVAVIFQAKKANEVPVALENKLPRETIKLPGIKH